MCGICGLIQSNPRSHVKNEWIHLMCDQMIHRGPDDQGIYVKGNVGLGSRRLSIIDLDSGRMPIHNEDESIWVVQNGEIYNYPNLVQLLSRQGHKFYTQSDTEVIVHAYEEFGDEFLNHLNGMYAIALWDGKKKKLILARDRTGIKPLYYATLQGRLIFGSEIKSILAAPGFERRIDMVALDEYLTFEYVPTPRSIFQDVYKLPPGHMLVYQDGKSAVSSYWSFDLSKSENLQVHSESEYKRQLLEIFRNVIQKEMISDVPLGVLLSGGLDSSTVAAFMVEASSSPIQSFSIAFEDPSFDESKYARKVAQYLGTEHHELTLTAGRMLDLVPRIGEFLDEPLGDSSLIPTFLLSKFVRNHVKVALGGDGGDELFAGYSTMQSHRLVQFYEKMLPLVVRHKLIPAIVGRLPVSFDNISLDFKAKRFISGRGVHDTVRHHRWLGSFTVEEKKRLLLPWAQLSEKDTFDVSYQHWADCKAESLINKILYNDMKMYMEGDILPKVDRASMANSLEVRVPLLNHSLVEFMAQVPHKMKLKGFTTKYLMKAVMKGRLPDAIINRGKKGFNMPVAKWLTGPLKPLAEDMFAPNYINRQGLFNPGYIRGLLDEHYAMRRDNRKLLWTLLVFQLWYDKWNK
jgi:asparagine synthase (glutamine-hydrolysing)